MRTRTFTVTAILVLTAAFGTKAQITPNSEDVLTGVAQAYTGLSSFHGEGTMQAEMIASGSDFKEQMSMVLELEPGRMRLAMKNEGANVIVIASGNTLWMYMPSANLYSKIQAPANSAAQTSTTGNYDVLMNYRDLPSKVEEATVVRSAPLELNGAPVNCWVLHVRFKPTQAVNAQSQPALPPNEGDLWIDESNDWVLRDDRDDHLLVAGVAHENKRSLEFDKISMNGTIPDSDFAFTPPAGSHEFDLMGLLAPGSK